MKKYLKLGLFGFLMWLIPFMTGFLIFPLKDTQPSLFDSLITFTLAVGAMYFSYLYLRDLQANYIGESIIAGAIWFAVNIAIDLPLFLFGIFSKMSLADYMMDIGLNYLIIPVVAIGYGLLLKHRAE